MRRSGEAGERIGEEAEKIRSWEAEKKRKDKEMKGKLFACTLSLSICRGIRETFREAVEKKLRSWEAEKLRKRRIDEEKRAQTFGDVDVKKLGS